MHFSGACQKRRAVTFLALAVSVWGTAIFMAPAHAQTAGWKPEKNVELVVGTSPGSGTDASARLIQKLWQDKRLVEVQGVVVNKPGGGSAVANAYVHQRTADPHYLTVASYNLVTNHITGKSNLSHQDFTAIAQLFNEYVSFNVRADSPVRTGKDLIERLRRDPGSVNIAISSSVGGANHIALGLAAKAVGVDIRKLKTVVFNSGGDSTTALLGGHIDVQAVAASVVVPQLNAGRIRTIAVSAPQRLGGPFANVPTWKEQGIDVVAANWRNVVAPKGLTDAQIAYWDNVFRKLTQMEDWKRDLDKNYWAESYMNSRQSKKYLDAQYAEIKNVLSELGLAR